MQYYFWILSLTFLQEVKDNPNQSVLSTYQMDNVEQNIICDGVSYSVKIKILPACKYHHILNSYASHNSRTISYMQYSYIF